MIITSINVPQIDPLKEDKIVWRGKEGNVSIKKVLEHRRVDSPKVQWWKLSLVFTMHSQTLFYSLDGNTMKVITPDKMQISSSCDVDICPLCMNDTKDHNHLFFNCDHSKQKYGIKLKEWIISWCLDRDCCCKTK